jgi:hypothetical protein
MASSSSLTQYFLDRIILALEIDPAAFTAAFSDPDAGKAKEDVFLAEYDGLAYVFDKFVSAPDEGGVLSFFMVEPEKANEAPKLRAVLNAQAPAFATKSVYFIKTCAMAVSQASAVAAELPEQFEFGCVAGDALANLSLVLREVFAPQIPSEFKSNIQKFESQVHHAIQQVKGDVHLNIPDVDITSDISAVADDFDLYQKLELALDEWSKLVASVVEQETSKRPKGKGPLAEIEFWQQRNGALSALYEQINLPKVAFILEVLKHEDAPMMHHFTAHFGELSKFYLEAKDNVKFLTTLERHFKNVSEGSFGTILDTLPSMMNAIRMVWIISRHYNNDERMVPLMERIAGKIAEKVAQEVNIRTILRQPPEIAKATISEARKVSLFISSYHISLSLNLFHISHSFFFFSSIILTHHSSLPFPPFRSSNRGNALT